MEEDNCYIVTAFTNGQCDSEKMPDDKAANRNKDLLGYTYGAHSQCA